MMHGDTHLMTVQDALDHIAKHREAGDYVPSDVDERLRGEAADQGKVKAIKRKVKNE